MSLQKIVVEVINTPEHVVTCPALHCKGNDGIGVCLTGPVLVEAGGIWNVDPEEGLLLECDVFACREE